ncbi:MAG: hypothetical protein V7K64_32845 [Nostoc sp.]|uniref:hypothetical protein n=1 Tax=unclassified Nostoc TaxID=2593658 RepID=UPI001D8289C8|nr:hypothetical protein [Nostoc sp. JL34]MBN3882696.1 hypothetical protein [Nostoc sp. JL34]
MFIQRTTDYVLLVGWVGKPAQFTERLRRPFYNKYLKYLITMIDVVQVELTERATILRNLTEVFLLACGFKL